MFQCYRRFRQVPNGNVPSPTTVMYFRLKLDHSRARVVLPVAARMMYGYGY